MVKAETTLYRRERWETPDGETLIAPLQRGSWADAARICIVSC